MANLAIWEKKYKFGAEEGVEATFRRVARFVGNGDQIFEEALYNEFCGLRSLPGGRILASGGTGKAKATLSNCFVNDSVPDDMASIMETLKDGALTMQSGGGIGINFSNLRPAGAKVRGAGAKASGPISFMRMWNEMSLQISGVGDRKGAMIAVLNCDHPDILDFVTAKAGNSKSSPVLNKFNISVGITDPFMDAVKNDWEWDLKHGGKIYSTIRARDLWNLILTNAHQKAEPGILFLDRINDMNNLYYAERIEATNPCGEQPLAPNDSCNLWAMNLTKFVLDPFGQNPQFDFETFRKSVAIAVRALDNVLDLNYYPLPAQRESVRLKRKVGLGIMGLGSALTMLTVRYGSDESLALVGKIMETLRNTAYLVSTELAEERGAFPLFDREQYLQGHFIRRLPEEVRERIARFGIRNANLTTIAPTGSIAQLADDVSSGVEPVFQYDFIRTNYGEEVGKRDYSLVVYHSLFGDRPQEELPPYFANALELGVEEHLKVMAACQCYVDASISKTINLPESITVQEMGDVYFKAYELGLKGCTVYRTGSLDEEILKVKDTRAAQKVNAPTGRPYRLGSETFKVKPPEQRHAFYVTFTHAVDETGKKRPVEMFINTKDPQISEWTNSMGRLVSAVFRNVEDATFIADEFKDVHAPSGYFSSHRRRHVHSLTAEFGFVMSDYFELIGLTSPEVPIELYENEYAGGNGNGNGKSPLGTCTKCGKQTVVFQEGCAKCLSCLYSKCG